MKKGNRKKDSADKALYQKIRNKDSGEIKRLERSKRILLDTFAVQPDNGVRPKNLI